LSVCSSLCETGFAGNIERTNMVLQQNTKVNILGENPIPEKQLKFVLHGLPRLQKFEVDAKRKLDRIHSYPFG